jgi:hypothetical protein
MSRLVFIGKSDSEGARVYGRRGRIGREGRGRRSSEFRVQGKTGGERALAVRYRLTSDPPNLNSKF